MTCPACGKPMTRGDLGATVAAPTSGRVEAHVWTCPCGMWLATVDSMRDRDVVRIARTA